MQSYRSTEPDPPGEHLPVAPYNSWLGPIGPFSLLFALLPPLALLLAPADVLDRYPVFQGLSRWTAGKFPAIYMHADQSHIPQVIFLVDTLVLFSTLAIAAVAILYGLVNYRLLLRRHRMTGPHPIRTYAIGALASPLFAFVILQGYALPGVITATPEDTQGRSATYALFGFFVPYLAGLFFGAAPLFLRLFIDAHLFNRPVTTSSDP